MKRDDFAVFHAYVCYQFAIMVDDGAVSYDEIIYGCHGFLRVVLSLLVLTCGLLLRFASGVFVFWLRGLWRRPFGGAFVKRVKKAYDFSNIVPLRTLRLFSSLSRG